MSCLTPLFSELVIYLNILMPDFFKNVSPYWECLVLTQYLQIDLNSDFGCQTVLETNPFSTYLFGVVYGNYPKFSDR